MLPDDMHFICESKNGNKLEIVNKNTLEIAKAIET